MGPSRFDKGELNLKYELKVTFTRPLQIVKVTLLILVIFKGDLIAEKVL